MSAEELFIETQELLIRTFTPEAVRIHASRPDAVGCLEGFDLVDEYAKQQYHRDLPSFVSSLLKSQSCWTDAVNVRCCHHLQPSALGGGFQSNPYPDARLEEVMLHAFSSSQDMESIITKFYQGRSAGEQQFFIIRADPAAGSLRMIELTRFMCERARADFVQHFTGEEKGEADIRVVMVVVHLERGQKSFSFDFDSC